jgi:cobalt-zinc-cadmium efflux system membrane fusion protein
MQSSYRKDFSENKSTEMHCHFTKYDKTLLPGMYMNAEIELNSQQSNNVFFRSYCKL